MRSNSSDSLAATGSDLGACRALLRGGSKSFHAASLLLPMALRNSATALYAFCRLADDAVDGGGDIPTALQALRHRLDLVYSGRPPLIAADRAFAAVVERHGIPRTLPEALLEGFSWDGAGRRYATLGAVQDYAARVAGSVGVMMALLMGQRDPKVLGSAADLGVAMQLTNIVRDVGEDARNGRLYLPEEWLREAGIDPDAWLAAPRFTPQLVPVIERLLEQAAVLYRRAADGIGWLPWSCRPGIHSARLLYSQIGAAVRANGCDSVSTRARVGNGRKLQLLQRAVGESLRARAELVAPLAETRYLVEAVAAQPVASPTGPSQLTPTRVEWLLELFERLERQQRPTRVSG